MIVEEGVGVSKSESAEESCWWQLLVAEQATVAVAMRADSLDKAREAGGV